MKILGRLLASCIGAALAALLVALFEARGVRMTLPVQEPWQLLYFLLGLVAPFAMLMGLGLGGYLAFISPREPLNWVTVSTRARGLPMLERSRLAAGLPISVILAFAWTTTVANVAPLLLARGEPAVVAGELGALVLGSGVVALGIGLALLSPARRLVARLAEKSHRFVDPVTTLTIGLFFVAMLLIAGAHFGDASGRGPAPLSVYGVLTRAELDLRPLGAFVLLGLGAFVGQAVYGGARPALYVFSALFFLAGGATTLQAARIRSAAIVRNVEQGAPFGRMALAVLRRAMDRDHDGYAAAFGGGDCDDGDKSRSPAAMDIAGNGIDEDCSGADLPKMAPVTSPSSQARTLRVASNENLILITIDTLRPDLAFMG